MKKLWLLALIGAVHPSSGVQERPNILFCISDDQSYEHTGANGDPVVKTPAFDRIAREGLRFTHAFCDAPTCGPSRSAILTGLPLLDEKDARHLFHQLTGSAGSLGLSALSDLCREFEGKGVELGESLVQLLTELLEKSAVEAREVLSLNRPGE